MIAVNCLRLLCETFGTHCRNRSSIDPVYKICTNQAAKPSNGRWYSSTLELAALAKVLGDVSVAQRPVYLPQQEGMAIEGLAGPADGSTASGPEERHVLGAKCIRALSLLHANMCGICVHSRTVLTGELSVDSNVQCGNVARAISSCVLAKACLCGSYKEDREVSLVSGETQYSVRIVSLPS